MELSLNHEFKLMLRGAPPPGRDIDFERELDKRVPTAKYHGQWKLWWAPLGLGACRGFSTMEDVVMSDELKVWLKDQEFLAKARVVANKIKDETPERARARLEKAGIRLKAPPFDHQAVSLAFALALPSCGLFLDTGTGKTCVGAMLMQALVDLFDKKRFLVVAPKTLLSSAWAEDIERFSWLTYTDLNKSKPADVCPICKKHFKAGSVSWPHLRTHMKKKIRRAAKVDLGKKNKDLSVIEKSLLKKHEDEAKAKFYEAMPHFKPKSAAGRVERIAAQLKTSKSNVFLINPESFRLGFDAIMEQEWDGILIDESSILKDPSSQTTQKMIRIGMKTKRKVIMSATPRPNHEFDWFGQMAFVDMCLGSSFSAYRDKFFRKLDKMGYVWGARAGATGKISNIVFDRAIRYRLDDCVDLPGENYETHVVDLSKDTRKLYDEMAEEYVLKLESGERIEGFNSLVVMNKLSQIAGGFIFDQEKEAHVMSDTRKIDYTASLARKLIEQEGHEAVIIWIRFSSVESKLLEERLKDLGVSTAHGHTRNTEDSIARFKRGETKVMIANPQSVMFGHTWTHCRVAIFHSTGHSWEQYYQSKRRIYRISQKYPVLYINVVARDTVDEDIVKAVTRKEKQSEKAVDEFVLGGLRSKYGHQG